MNDGDGGHEDGKAEDISEGQFAFQRDLYIPEKYNRYGDQHCVGDDVEDCRCFKNPVLAGQSSGRDAFDCSRG